MTTTTTSATTGRALAPSALAALQTSYRSLVKAGHGSVQSAWLFGECIDGYSHTWTMRELADALDLSPGTLGRYHRLYLAYQTAELAVEASDRLGTFNIDLIWSLQAHLNPIQPARPYAGRRYRYTCKSCHSQDVARVEYDPDTGLEVDPATGATLPADETGQAVQLVGVDQ